jgi:hypothetical protein
MTITFKPKQITKKLLATLPPRAKEVVVGRYGLDDEVKKMTLEAIGKNYKITRERVRQIEAYALNTIRKSDAYKKEAKMFEELELFVRGRGGLVPEHDLFPALSKDKSTQNHLHFLMSLGEKFRKHKESDEFHHRWHIDEKLSDQVHNALTKLYNGLKDDEILPESEMISAFLEHLKDVNEEYKKEEILRRWLSMSKLIDKNPLGEWGKATSSNVNTKGIRDYAYLIIRRHGSPIHFREVAKLITQVFGKSAHIATTHNELIKDERFVLVGRGLYALSEWGYLTGVVKDVIQEILIKHGPLTKKEVVDKVLKERYVKENTVVINLQNAKWFNKSEDGKYSVKNK